MIVNVISKPGLRKLVEMAQEAEKEALAWFKIARSAQWRSFAEVRQTFPDADLFGNVLIFNLRHNRYRLIVRVSFRISTLWVKELLTHKEYDRGGWKKWA
jgi:mRNA interferase HigB